MAGLVSRGAWAQLAAVPVNRMAPVPAGVPDVQAATFPTAGLTALRALEIGGLWKTRAGHRCFQAGRFARARGAAICTLNLPDELAAHASAASDLTRLCTLAAGGRLDGQIELECSWRQPGPAIDALLNRGTGGKAVLYVD